MTRAEAIATLKMQMKTSRSMSFSSMAYKFGRCDALKFAISVVEQIDKLEGN